jgi:hypothetical protein
VFPGGQLAVEHIHSYLVHPGKGTRKPPQIRGTKVALDGKLFRLLDNIYAASDVECDIDISFNHSGAGLQQNPCRDLITRYLRKPVLGRGRTIAKRLQQMTDHRSGLGLLFLIAGREGNDHKIIISRFPTDTAILAEEGAQELTVQFLERVFMKSASSYKAAAYQDSSLQAGFWLGRAVDRQITSRIVELSGYWIFDFLDSNFQLTPAAGTRRLGMALRNAAKNTDLNVKREIVAAVTLAGGLKGKSTSISEFEERFGLSKAARDAINGELKTPALAEEHFRFDLDEFNNQVGYRSLELDNGAMMIAQSAEFDDVFHQEILDKKKHEVQISTKGRVVSERLRKAQ